VTQTATNRGTVESTLGWDRDALRALKHLLLHVVYLAVLLILVTLWRTMTKVVIIFCSQSCSIAIDRTSFIDWRDDENFRQR